MKDDCRIIIGYWGLSPEGLGWESKMGQIDYPAPTLPRLRDTQCVYADDEVLQ